MSPYILVIMGIFAIIGSVVMAIIPSDASPGYEITWLGDTFLGDRAEQTLEENGYDWAFAKLPDFGSSHLTVLNAEAPLTSLNELPDTEIIYKPPSPTARYYVYTSRGRVTRYIHRSSPVAAQAFARFGVDIATLGNNHALDQGPQGLADTVAALNAAGIASIGAGQNSAEALKPFITDTPYGRLAIFSFGEECGTAPNATADSPGICALNIANMNAARALAKAAGVKWLVAAVHWGNNYTDVVPAQEKWARRLADNGFHLVIGSGAHVHQRIDIMGRTPIIYSLGNFAYLCRGQFTEDNPGYGLAVTTVLGPRGFREIRVSCIQTDNMIVEYQPRLCDPATAKQVLESLSSGIEIEGNTGVIRW